MAQKQIPQNSLIIDGKGIINANIQDAESRLNNLETVKPSFEQLSGVPQGTTGGFVWTFESATNAWVPKAIPNPTWTNVQNKPTVFPPESHAHDYAPAAHVNSTNGHPVASTTLPGFQSAADKAKLNLVPNQDRRLGVQRNTAQVIANSTWTQVSYDVVNFDPLSWYTNATTVTVNESGMYVIWHDLSWANNSTGERLNSFLINGAVWGFQRLPASVTSNVSNTVLAWMDAGSTIGSQVWQSSGANLSLSGAQRLRVARLL